MPIGECSSRWATTKIATSVCWRAPSKRIGHSCLLKGILLPFPLRQGVISGVFRIKGAGPWAITRAEKLQLSVFLPNDLTRWVVCSGLCPTHGMAWCVYVGSQQFAQGGRLWLSPPKEEVWCPRHVGQFTHNGDCCSWIWKPKGLVSTRFRRGKSGSLPTGLIGLKMTWKMNLALTVILLHGVCGARHKTGYGSYASQVHP